MSHQIITTRTGKVWLGEDGILRCVSLPGIHMTLAEAQENIAAGMKFDDGGKRPVLLDIRLIKGIDRDARAYFASRESSVRTSAIALLVHSPLSRVVANFFLGLNKMPMPIHLFPDEGEAIEWLKGFHA